MNFFVRNSSGLKIVDFPKRVKKDLGFLDSKDVEVTFKRKKEDTKSQI